MTIELLSVAADEPVSLAEAKAFARIEHAAEDALITTLLTAARENVEALTGLALVGRSVREALERPDPAGRVRADGALELAFRPLLSLDRVALRGRDGTERALDLAAFRSDQAAASFESAGGGPPFPPEAFSDGGRVIVEARFGFGGPAAIPAALREAVLRVFGAAFEARSAPPPDPLALIGALIGPFRRRRL